MTIPAGLATQAPAHGSQTDDGNPVFRSHLKNFAHLQELREKAVGGLSGAAAGRASTSPHPHQPRPVLQEEHTSHARPGYCAQVCSLLQRKRDSVANFLSHLLLSVDITR